MAITNEEKQALLNVINAGGNGLSKDAKNTLEKVINALVPEINSASESALLPNRKVGFIKPASGQYTPTLGVENNGLCSINNQEVAHPFRLDYDMTISAIQVNSIGSANALENMSIAIFEADENNVPGTKVANSTVVNLDVAGFNNGLIQIPISYTLEAGKNYWLVIAKSGASRSLRGYNKQVMIGLAASTNEVANPTYYVLVRPISSDLANLDAWVFNVSQYSTNNPPYTMLKQA